MSWSYYTIAYYKYMCWTKICMQITIHKKHKHIYKYIKQERIKSQLVNLFEKCSEYYNTWSHGILFITHDKRSPPAPFRLVASKVMLVSTPLWHRSEVKTPLCTNMNRYNVSSITSKLRYIFFHKSCPIESRVRSFNNSQNVWLKYS